ncbi:hypothetical protein BJY52DRAFT_1125539 [Lactarius psammicola]|nr:hypothetical protein BJY52DRAFT_1125539 [Lactarius psammicola]
MTERWWRDRYNDIAEQGYRLRPRYNPQWGPSWFKTGKDFYTTEDGQATISKVAMDAIRIQDGLPIILKKVLPEECPQELGINRLFSSPEISRERDNHCAPLLNVIELPVSSRFGSQKLMVFPLLRPFNQPRIQTFGEFAAFFTQICEARPNFTCPCIVLNLFLTGYPIPASAKSIVQLTTSRLLRRNVPLRYYFIDFGLSRRYPSRDTMDDPLPGGDESAPEHQPGRRLCNPFHTDIYYIGNLIRKEFMGKYNDFEFMENLVASMTQDDPAERPPD